MRGRLVALYDKWASVEKDPAVAAELYRKCSELDPGNDWYRGETLSRVALDLGGRPYLVLQMANKKKKILDFELSLLGEFLRAFVTQARMNLHIHQLYGEDAHHAWESVFKGLARALKVACRHDPRVKGVPSSKGIL